MLSVRVLWKSGWVPVFGFLVSGCRFADVGLLLQHRKKAAGVVRAGCGGSLAEFQRAVGASLYHPRRALVKQ